MFHGLLRRVSVSLSGLQEELIITREKKKAHSRHKKSGLTADYARFAELRKVLHREISVAKYIHANKM